MLARRLAWAQTREAAIERMHRALLELTIDGVETSRDFHLRLMEDGEFRRGEIEIQWLERRLKSRVEVKPPRAAVDAAIVAAALLADRDRNRGPSLPQVAAGSPANGSSQNSGWRATGLSNVYGQP